jgi:hypothetical protein
MEHHPPLIIFAVFRRRVRERDHTIDGGVICAGVCQRFPHPSLHAVREELAGMGDCKLTLKAVFSVFESPSAAL